MLLLVIVVGATTATDLVQTGPTQNSYQQPQVPEMTNAFIILYRQSMLSSLLSPPPPLLLSCLFSCSFHFFVVIPFLLLPVFLSSATPSPSHGSILSHIFVCAATLVEVVWSAYLGGSFDDTATSVAVAPDGRIYVTGYTNSVDFPVKFPYQAQKTSGDNMDIEAFIAVFNVDGVSLLLSFFLL